MQKVFANKLVKGLAIGAQPTFCDDFNLVQDILQNVEVLPPLKLDKTGIDWRLSVDGGAGSQEAVTKVVNNPVSAIPVGYEEETLNVVTNSGIVTRTVLVRSDTKATVKSFSGSDNKKILQINSAGNVIIDSGYLV